MNLTVVWLPHANTELLLFHIANLTLRYAKGNNLTFGGIMIMFARDFFQYPPVGGTPLYTPMQYSKKNDEITD